MYKFLFTICLMACSLLLITSCRDEDEIRMPDLQTGANVRVIPDATKSFLDFNTIETAAYAFDVYSKNTDIEKIEFGLSFVDASEGTASDTVIAHTLTQSDFVNGKARVEFSASDLATLVELSGPAALGGGDLFNFITFATLTGGRTFNYRNSAPSIVNSTSSSFTVAFTTFVGGCTSDIPTGTWTLKAFVDAFGVITDTETKVTIVKLPALGPEFYTVSDVSGGFYTNFDFKAIQPVQIRDICGTIFITGNTGAEFNIGQSAAEGFGAGSYDPVTKKMILPWYDTGNEFGGLATLTKD